MRIGTSHDAGQSLPDTNRPEMSAARVYPDTGMSYARIEPDIQGIGHFFVVCGFCTE